MTPFIQRRLLSTLLGLTVTTTGAAAFADVVLHHNVIHGQARFSATDPIVVALLGETEQESTFIQAYNGPDDLPLSGDFDGDGKTDNSVWRPSQTKFYTIRSSDIQVAGGVVFGASTDIPVNGDFDGDGKADWALFRPSTATWDILQSSTNTHVTYQWGKSGDLPIPPPQE